MYEIPILLVLYNRPFETHNLFQQLHELKPAKLYVAADGPIEQDQQDAANCFRARCVIMPEWPCKVKNFHNDIHLGKSKMIYQAIKWFFENENEGVILFDDCMPHLDFFPYCQELLKRYRDDKRVFHIGGVNLRKHVKALKRKHKKHDDCSYYFSAYANTWGFATWKDRWEDFDMDISKLEGANFNQLVKQYTRRPKERQYWQRRFNLIKKTQEPIWDYQYNFHIWLNSGLAITPTTNLVTNVGVRTKSSKHKVRRLIRKAYPILPLKHPETIALDNKADRFMFKQIYSRAFIKVFANWINDVIKPPKEDEEW